MFPKANIKAYVPCLEALMRSILGTIIAIANNTTYVKHEKSKIFNIVSTFGRLLRVTTDEIIVQGRVSDITIRDSIVFASSDKISSLRAMKPAPTIKKRTIIWCKVARNSIKIYKCFFLSALKIVKNSIACYIFLISHSFDCWLITAL